VQSSGKNLNCGFGENVAGKFLNLVFNLAFNGRLSSKILIALLAGLRLEKCLNFQHFKSRDLGASTQKNFKSLRGMKF
jgi:hypothetical protein